MEREGIQGRGEGGGRGYGDGEARGRSGGTWERGGVEVKTIQLMFSSKLFKCNQVVFENGKFHHAPSNKNVISACIVQEFIKDKKANSWKCTSQSKETKVSWARKTCVRDSFKKLVLNQFPANCLEKLKRPVLQRLS